MIAAMTICTERGRSVAHPYGVWALRSGGPNFPTRSAPLRRVAKPLIYWDGIWGRAPFTLRFAPGRRMLAECPHLFTLRTLRYTVVNLTLHHPTRARVLIYLNGGTHLSRFRFIQRT